MRWTAELNMAREKLSLWFFRGMLTWDYGDWRDQDWSVLAEYFTHE